MPNLNAIYAFVDKHGQSVVHGRSVDSPVSSYECHHGYEAEYAMPVNLRRETHELSSDAASLAACFICEPELESKRMLDYLCGAKQAEPDVSSYIRATGDWKCRDLLLLDQYIMPTSDLSEPSQRFCFIRVERPLSEAHARDNVGPGAIPHHTSDLSDVFYELVEKWHEETMFTSSIMEMCTNSAYQRIIGLGPDAIPLILRELQRAPDHWSWALTAMTGENPVSPEDVGDIVKMAKAWLDWGRQRGYL